MRPFWGRKLALPTPGVEKRGERSTARDHSSNCTSRGSRKPGSNSKACDFLMNPQLTSWEFQTSTMLLAKQGHAGPFFPSLIPPAAKRRIKLLTSCSEPIFKPPNPKRSHCKTANRAGNAALAPNFSQPCSVLEHSLLGALFCFTGTIFCFTGTDFCFTGSTFCYYLPSSEGDGAQESI